MTAPVKTCGCSRSFTRAAWEALPVVGKGIWYPDTEGPGLDLRVCPCGSSIAIEVPKPEETK